MNKEAREEGLVFAPRFDEDGLIPTIVQQYDSGEILMLAYMNQEALEKTQITGEAHYWSRSRQCLWHKGATSGHIQEIVDIRVDCDQDAILLRVKQKGQIACHTGRSSCFYRTLVSGVLKFLDNF